MRALILFLVCVVGVFAVISSHLYVYKQGQENGRSEVCTDVAVMIGKSKRTEEGATVERWIVRYLNEDVGFKNRDQVLRMLNRTGQK